MLPVGAVLSTMVCQPTARADRPDMRKQERTFQCRDDLWKRVEALASRKGVSTDEIIQSALVQVFSRKKSGAEGVVTPPASSRKTIPALRDPSAAPASRKRPPPISGSATPAKATELFVVYEGTTHEVGTSEFIIGRAPRACNLAIKDPNISRTHCRIVWEEGKFFIRDLGSTNGIEHHGVRVDDHRIEEGAIYHLCDHELRCTYKRPR